MDMLSLLNSSSKFFTRHFYVPCLGDRKSYLRMDLTFYMNLLDEMLMPQR